MTCYYLDASAWVKRYYQEARTSWVQNLFNQNSIVACASLGVVEVIATLARKCKAGEIKRDLLEQAQELDDDWKRFVQIQFTIETENQARLLAMNLALRGADAIHLASSLLLQKQIEQDDKVILVTSDRQLKEPALASNLVVLDPTEQVNGQ